MNKQVILDYLKDLKKEDIISYTKKQNIIITNNDIDTIYDYIKNNPNKIINNLDYSIKEIKSKVSINGYNVILEMYNKYKFLIDKIK